MGNLDDGPLVMTARCAIHECGKPVALSDGHPAAMRAGHCNAVYLEYFDDVAFSHQILNSRRIPVRGADAAVARGSPDRLWIISPMNADMRFVQTHPKNADWIIWSGRQVVEILRSHP